MAQEETLESFAAATPIVVKPNITALIIASSNCSTVSDDYELADLAQERATEARIVALSRAASRKHPIPKATAARVSSVADSDKVIWSFSRSSS